MLAGVVGANALLAGQLAQELQGRARPGPGQRHPVTLKAVSPKGTRPAGRDEVASSIMLSAGQRAGFSRRAGPAAGQRRTSTCRCPARTAEQGRPAWSADGAAAVPPGPPGAGLRRPAVPRRRRPPPPRPRPPSSSAKARASSPPSAGSSASASARSSLGPGQRQRRRRAGAPRRRASASPSSAQFRSPGERSASAWSSASATPMLSTDQDAPATQQGQQPGRAAVQPAELRATRTGRSRSTATTREVGQHQGPGRRVRQRGRQVRARQGPVTGHELTKVSGRLDQTAASGWSTSPSTARAPRRSAT